MDDPVDSSTAIVHSFEGWLRFSGFGLVFFINLWFVVDAVRRREWIWAVILLLVPGVGNALVLFPRLSRLGQRGERL